MNTLQFVWTFQLIKTTWAPLRCTNGAPNRRSSVNFRRDVNAQTGSKVSLVTLSHCTGGLEIKRPTHTPPTTQSTESGVSVNTAVHKGVEEVLPTERSKNHRGRSNWKYKRDDFFFKLNRSHHQQPSRTHLTRLLSPLFSLWNFGSVSIYRPPTSHTLPLTRVVPVWLSDRGDIFFFFYRGERASTSPSGAKLTVKSKKSGSSPQTGECVTVWFVWAVYLRVTSFFFVNEVSNIFRHLLFRHMFTVTHLIFTYLKKSVCSSNVNWWEFLPFTRAN